MIRSELKNIKSLLSGDWTVVCQQGREVDCKWVYLNGSKESGGLRLGLRRDGAEIQEVGNQQDVARTV